MKTVRVDLRDQIVEALLVHCPARQAAPIADEIMALIRNVPDHAEREHRVAEYVGRAIGLVFLLWILVSVSVVLGITVHLIFGGH